MVSRPEPGRFLGRWFVPVLLAVPLFAHGCHTGEHDDEPAVLPARAVEVLEPEVAR